MHHVLHILRGLSDATIATVAIVLLMMYFAMTYAPVYLALPTIAKSLGH